MMSVKPSFSAPSFETPEEISVSPYDPDRPLSRTSEFVKDIAQIKLVEDVFMLERKETEKGKYQYRILAVGAQGALPKIAKVYLDAKGRLLGVAIAGVGPLSALGCLMQAVGYTKV